MIRCRGPWRHLEAVEFATLEGVDWFNYNLTVVALVIVGALGAFGPVQWAAVVLHGAQAIWCARVVAESARVNVVS